MKNLFIIVLLASIYGCNGQASTTPDIKASISAAPVVSAHTLSPIELRHYRTEVEQFIDSTFGHRQFNGSILVAKNGEVIYEKYSGFWNPRLKRDSISPSTPFHLASVSKTFTAMAIMKMQEQGKININDPVSNYLTGFPLQGVTVKTLLNHRSGIPNYVHYMERLGWDRKKHVTNKDVLDFIITHHKEIQINQPDKRFSYSNTNFALLALIAEKISGLPFPEYMRINFFEPLGMHDTYIFTMSDSARFLRSYFASGREYAFDYLDQVYGDKNVYSTVRDMLKWDQALYGGTFFKKETLDSAFSGYSFEKPGINNYGLGWRMFLLRSGKKFVYHNGWWHGNRTAFYRLPDDKVTIIALSNNDFTKVYSSKKLADIFGNYFNNREEDQASETVNTVKASAPEEGGGK
ncbi:MAG TPA: serine hydrolase domain-containing protein [Flavitalea sp.]|nr:serine hydrolase domain-containing protein [Flavitalea sp.]